MCLEVETLKIYRATTDITCYKALIKDTLESVYLHHPHKVGETLSMSEEKFKVKSSMYFWDRRIEEGFHSFTNIHSAENFVKRYKKYQELCIADCIIPAGSLYKDGIFETIGLEGYWPPTKRRYSSYASTQIKILRIIE